MLNMVDKNMIITLVLNWPPHFSELHDAPHSYDEVSEYIWVVGFSCVIAEWLFMILSHYHKFSNLLCPSSTTVLSKFPL